MDNLYFRGMLKLTKDRFLRLVVLTLSMLLLNQAAFTYPVKASDTVHCQTELSENLLLDILEWSYDEDIAQFLPMEPFGEGQPEQPESGSNTEEEYNPSEHQLVDSKKQFRFHTFGTSVAMLCHSHALISNINDIPTPPPQA